jgi:WD40 repeat protein
MLPTEIPIESSPDFIQSAGEKVLLDFALSPDGNKLVTYENTGIYSYDLASMRKQVFTGFNNNNYTRIRSGAVAFSPDGEQLAISGKFNEAAITIWEVKSKSPTETIQGIPETFYVTEIMFSPNGKTILFRNTDTHSTNCQGDVKDRVILHNIEENKNIFEIDKCAIYPPIRFHFVGDNSVFFYFGEMSPKYTVFIVDSETGQISSQKELDWDRDGNFYDISPDGDMNLVEKNDNEKRLTYMLDSKTNEVLGTFEGKVIFLREAGGFVVSSYDQNSQWSFWENGEFKCVYNGIKQFPEIKTSADGEIFAMPASKSLQIWKTSTCGLIGEIQFDK